MNVCYANMKNKQKEWHHATKPFNFWGQENCFGGTGERKTH
jgi:hypothetical protein